MMGEIRDAASLSYWTCFKSDSVSVAERDAVPNERGGDGDETSYKHGGDKEAEMWKRQRRFHFVGGIAASMRTKFFTRKRNRRHSN